MIKLQDLTPRVYYEQSRDFQFIGRLYDIVLNYVKTNADNLYTLPIGKNMDEKLLNLLAFTLGFQSKHHYNSKQLLAICSVLPLILKNKGSLNAILIAVNSILYAEGINQALDYEFKNNNLVLYLSQDLSDLTLLKDIMIYILPAGIGCDMIKEIQSVNKIETILTTKDEVTVAYEGSANALNRILNLREKADKDILAGGRPAGNAGMLVNITSWKQNNDSKGDNYRAKKLKEAKEYNSNEFGYIADTLH